MQTPLAQNTALRTMHRLPLLLAALLAPDLASGAPSAPAPPRPMVAPTAARPTRGREAQGREARAELEQALEGEDRGAALEALGRLASGELTANAKLMALMVQTLGDDDPALVHAALDAIGATGPKILPLTEAALDDGRIAGVAIPKGAAARALLRLGDRGEAQLLGRTQEPGIHPEILEALAQDAEPKVALRELSRIAKHGTDRGWAFRSLSRLRRHTIAPRRGEPALPKKRLKALTKKLPPDLRTAVRDLVGGIDPDKEAPRVRDWAVSGDPLRAEAALHLVVRHEPKFLSLAPDIAALLRADSASLRLVATEALAGCTPLEALRPNDEDDRPRAGPIGPALAIGGGAGDDWRWHYRALGAARNGTIRPGEGLSRARRSSVPTRSEVWSFAPRWYELLPLEPLQPVEGERPPLRFRALRPEEQAPFVKTHRRLKADLGGSDPAQERASSECLMRWNVRDPRVVRYAWRAMHRMVRGNRPDHDVLAEAYLWSNLDALGPEIERLEMPTELSATAARMLLETRHERAETLVAESLTREDRRWGYFVFATVEGHAWRSEELDAKLRAYSAEALAQGCFLHAARVADMGAEALPTLRRMLTDERVDVRMVAASIARTLDGGEELASALRGLQEADEDAQAFVDLVLEEIGSD